MPCCCNDSCSECTPPTMQVDINVTMPASLLVLSGRGCICGNSIAVQQSIILLPTNTAPDFPGVVGYYSLTPSYRIAGFEYPCDGPTPTTFQLSIALRFGASQDVDFFCSGNPYECALQTGTYNPDRNPGGRVIDNSGNSFLTGHPCDVPPGKTACCLNSSKTYDFVVNPGLGGATIGTYTVTFF
jgi:hypothetical protein